MDSLSSGYCWLPKWQTIATVGSMGGGAEAPFESPGTASVLWSRTTAGNWLGELLVSVPGDLASAPQALEVASRYAAGISGLPLPTITVEPGCLRFTHRSPAAPWIEAGAGASPASLAQMVEEIAEALGFLHDQGVAHGHLRPELIWVGPRAFLGGFGVAGVINEIAGPRRAIAALPPQWCAPELRGAVSRAGPEADVFALGAMVAEWLDRIPSERAEAVRPLLQEATAEEPATRPRDVQVWARHLTKTLRAGPSRDSGSVGFGASPLGVLEEEASSPRIDEVAGSSAPAESDAAPEEVPASAKDEGPAGAGASNLDSTEEAGADTETPSSDSGERSSLPMGEAPAAAPSRREPMRHRAALGELARSNALERPRSSPRESAREDLETKWGMNAVLALLVGVALLLVGGVVVLFLLASQARTDVSARLPPPPSAAPSIVASSAPPGATPSVAPPAATPNASPRPVSQPRLDLAPSGSVLPSHSSASIPIDQHTPTLGSPEALVTVIVFGDLEQHDSQRVLRALRSLAEEQGPALRIAWRHLPTSPAGGTTARVAAAIQLRSGSDGFWRYARQVELSGSSSATVPPGLDVGEGASVVERDQTLAVVFGVRTTPTLFVQGIRLDGTLARTDLAGVIAHERQAAIELIAGGATPEEVYPRRVATNFIGVGEQPPKRRCPALRDSPVRGAAEPLVTIVEFADFECTPCAGAEATIERALAQGDVRVVWKDFPLQQHRHARLAAAWGRAVFREHGDDAFWRFHGALLASTEPLDGSRLEQLVMAAGLERDALKSRVVAGAYDAQIDRNIEQAADLHARGVPTYFINGIQADGFASERDFLKLVTRERTSAQRLVSHGLSPREAYWALCGSSADR